MHLLNATNGLPSFIGIGVFISGFSISKKKKNKTLKKKCTNFFYNI